MDFLTFLEIFPDCLALINQYLYSKRHDLSKNKRKQEK